MHKKIIGILTIILIIMSTVAYSALATSLAITGEAVFRAVANIRVTDIRMSEISGGTSRYESEYTKETITSVFTLTNTSSYVKYNVTITNNGEVDYAIYNLLTQSNNNSGLQIYIDNVLVSEMSPIIIPFHTTKTVTITYKTTTPGSVDVVNRFDFRKVHYVTYNLKGGSYTNEQEALKNGQKKYENVNLAITNEEPTKNGYTFIGWTDEQEGTTVKYNSGSSYTIDNNMILYALYEKNAYVITLDARNGQTPTTIEVDAGDTYGNLPTPTKNGYRFLGWYTEITGGNLVTNSDEPEEDTTLYAHWQVENLTITFNKNDNQATGDMSNKTCTSESECKLPENSYKREGYRFIGWNTESNGSGTSYLEEAVVDLANLESTTMTLYAQWIAKTYTVTLNKNGATNTPTASVSTTYNSSTITPSSITVPVRNYTVTISKSYTTTRKSTGVVVTNGGNKTSSYTFAGWYDTGATSGGSLILSNGTSPTLNAYTNSSGQWIKDNNTEVYARFTGGSVTLPGVTKSGYTCGWTEDNVGTTITYEKETSITPTSNMTLYAVCVPNTYTIVFDKNDSGATGTTANKTCTYGDNCTLTTNGYTGSGYNKFNGWNTESDGSGTSYTDGQTVSNLATSGSITLYAQWKVVRAVDLYYDNTNTGMACQTAQCAIDNISRILTRAGAKTSNIAYLCKRATTLHTETCNRTSAYCYADGYYSGGSKGTTTITYGSTGTSGTLTTGDAFDCDVNGDGTYDAITERFYYVSDYYDTNTKSFNSDYATLVYYGNVYKGELNNTRTAEGNGSIRAAYSSTGKNNVGPTTAVSHLPSVTTWKSTSLKNQSRQILNENAGTTTNAGDLPIFNYSGYDENGEYASAARLLTYQEIYNSCYDGTNPQFGTVKLSSKCTYLLENSGYNETTWVDSIFSGRDSLISLWTETPTSSSQTSAHAIVSTYASIMNDRSVNSYQVAIRPAIDVKKIDIQY